MSSVLDIVQAPAAVAGDALFLAPWRALDDAALLAHYRSERGVCFEPVVDPEEVRPERIAALMQGRFEFNGETHTLAEPIEWLVNPSADVEWHILLHKFYYAPGLAMAWQRSGDRAHVQRWAGLIDGWMRSVPPGFIAADVTGRRVQNWIYSLHGFVMHDRGGAAQVDAAFFRRLLRSLHEQVEFLCDHLTPKRNHRTLELLAIFLAGVVFPEFERAAHWREFALRETLVNLHADLLPDGVHCELSTDYHHLALRNWLQVRQLAAQNGVAVPGGMDAALQRALEFGMHVHQPHGGMPSFSDGDARGFGPLLLQGARLYGREGLFFVATQGAQGLMPARRNAHFGASGYHVLRSGWTREAQHLVFDCGPLGEGNHGHFDALSFELAAHGRALVVDPGRYTYSEAGETNWRVHFRSTAAHNTVCVDGRSQTRYEPKAIKEASRHAPGSVRHKIAGPAPDCTLIECIDGAQLDLLHGRCASHAYDAVHERCIVFVDRRYWIVADTLRAPGVHDYALKFQLGAAAQGHTRLADDGLLASPGLLVAQAVRADQRRELADSWVSALYGHKQAAPALVTQAQGAAADFDTVLLPFQGEAPTLKLDERPVLGDEGQVASALHIVLSIDGDEWHDGWFHARGVEANSWALGGLSFQGRWLHWRCSADGRIVRAVSHAGATLRGPAGSVRLLIEESA
ncbi:alginate lyase family protein [Rhizobacter sp. AJA081-3]|uniref:alginate lyase family protein n=1 Tax=Rhizobacter sp. AJA081-3 TaxID=2753607 RepID=UPI001ADF4D9F|nr:alginate lyase family protein [Rhizobacter sp. AJA081-3]QTN23343.1 alginate lyase family protein [Rhizobacter sp. AJA081-3]